MVEKLTTYKQEKAPAEDYVYGGFDDDFDDGPMEFPRFDNIDNPNASISQGAPIESLESPDADADADAPMDASYVHLDQKPMLDEPVDITAGIANMSLSSPHEFQTIKPKQKPIPLMFARQAKRVDVSKLKQNLWTKLDSHTETDANETETPHAPKVDEKSFTHIISELDDCYENKQRKDISVAFCFICVLHLANENNLSIREEGPRELKITQNLVENIV